MSFTSFARKIVFVCIIAGALVSGTTVFAEGRGGNQNMMLMQNAGMPGSFGGWGGNGPSFNMQMGGQFNQGQAGGQFNQGQTAGQNNNQNMNFMGGMQSPNNGMELSQNGMFDKAIQEIVKELDIDTSSMTKEEIVSAITAKLDDLSEDDLKSVATALGISTTDLTDAEIIQAIEDKIDSTVTDNQNATLKQVANILSIDTDSLTNSEIVTKVTAELDDLTVDKLLKVANSVHVDITGLTSSEIITKVEAALANLE